MVRLEGAERAAIEAAQQKLADSEAIVGQLSADSTSKARSTSVPPGGGVRV